MVALALSTVLLHWGWYKLVKCLVISNSSHIAAISFDIKVCPWSDTKVWGAPYLLMTSRYSTAATSVASWVLRGCASIHLE